MNGKNDYDVIIIGGGVVGSAVARELSRYKLSIAVLEKNLDVCFETSGRNSAVVHAGFAYDTGTLKAKLCVEGNQMMDELSKELDFPFIRCGKLLVGNTDEDMARLEDVLKQGAANGATGLELIDEKELHEICPAVNGKFAMMSHTSGILDPFQYTIALAENAHDNGAEYFFNEKVESITRDDLHNVYTIKTSNNTYQSRWVVNAAGLGCKDISDMLGLSDFKMIGSKGNYIILDKQMGPLLPLPVYPVPSNTYMGIHVTPTVDGNVIVGPDATPTHEFGYYGVSDDNIDYLATDAANLWPHIEPRHYIRNYSGILPKWIDDDGVIQDFKIEIKDDIAPHAVNLFGIESPGLTAAVPIARHAISLMMERENFELKDDFNPIHKGITHFATATDEERAKLIAEDPNYGELICHCERVSKAEVLAAINNPLGVCTMTSIKYRTRTMMGQCQGGFCQTKIEQLIEQEKGLAPSEVRYNKPDSWVLSGSMRKEA